MANYDDLFDLIDNPTQHGLPAWDNNEKAIEGTTIKQYLLTIINSLIVGYQFKGVAIPSTNPGTPDQKVAYLVATPGTYSNFSNLQVADDEIAVFVFRETWAKESLFNYSMMRGILPSGNLNGITKNGTWLLIDTNTYQNVPNDASVGFLRVSNPDGENDWFIQEFFDFNGSGYYKRRCLTSGGATWEDWQIINKQLYDNLKTETVITKGVLPSSNLNNVTGNGIWLLVDTNTYQSVPNNASVGFLRVTNAVLNDWILQEFYAFSGGTLYKRRGLVGGSWEDWQEVTGTTQVTNNYEFNSYQQTLNVTATPTINPDSEQYLATSDDTTDRTSDILTLLNQTGICRLGPGDFYVKNLIMPANTAIFGSGPKTRVILDSSVIDGFAIQVNSMCEIKDFQLVGSLSNITPSATRGTRHGILWQGDYTEHQNAPVACIISNLMINNFAGGAITCFDTGFGTGNFINGSNINIDRCDVGINISYWSEFHKFTNIRTDYCYIGCVNNGGNNVFVNCDFSSCIGKAMVMDNSQSQSPNNSHGSCIGCVFNHTASNTGVGIEILKCHNGFVFSGCQIYYSQINLVDSDGVVFDGCNCGADNCDITISGGGAIIFANCMYDSDAFSISITNNQNVHFVNCYRKTTGAIVEP